MKLRDRLVLWLGGSMALLLLLVIWMHYQATRQEARQPYPRQPQTSPRSAGSDPGALDLNRATGGKPG